MTSQRPETAARDNPPSVPADDCEHHWESRHKPGHLLYWVRQCSTCHQVDWDELDREVKHIRDSSRRAPGRGKVRTAGSRWRILVHDRLHGKSHDVTSDPQAPERHAATAVQLNSIRPCRTATADTTTVTVLENTEFDELVIGRFLHLEQMDAGLWWLSVGGVVIDVKADRDGRPKRVIVHGPGDYDGPVEGCTYQLEWSSGEGTAP